MCSPEHHPSRDTSASVTASVSGRSLHVADAALIALATVYTQNHYAFDALTGFLVVLVLQCAAIPLLEGRRLTIPWLISESAS